MESDSVESKVPETEIDTKDNSNPTDSSEGKTSDEVMDVDCSNKETTDNPVDPDLSNEVTPSTEKGVMEEPSEDNNAKITEKELCQDEKTRTEIAQVSMDELSSDATPLDEGADPMPEGEEATSKEKIAQDNEVQPDVAGTEVETVSTETKQPKESESLPPENTKYIITHHNSQEDQMCCMCDQKSAPKYIATKNKEMLYICVDECLSAFKEKHHNNYIEKILRLRAFATQEKLIPEPREEEFECEKDEEASSGCRACGFCKAPIIPEMHIAWEAMDFCNEGCLLNYQRTINSTCGKCQTSIFENSIGKYCVRFGSVITQFCSTACIISYKKSSAFFCAFCQQEMQTRSEYKSFCSKRCLETCQTCPKEKAACAVCHEVKPVVIRVRMVSSMDSVCGERCFMAYKFVNKIQPIKCEACITHFEPQGTSDPVVYLNNKAHIVCSEECQKIFLLMHRKIISCSTCSIKKYDFDMVKVYDMGQEIKYTCSNACMKVNFSKRFQEIEDAAEVNIKQLENSIKDTDLKVNGKNLSEVLKSNGMSTKTPVHKITLTKPRPFIKQRNISTMCKPNLLNKSVSCKPEYSIAEVQTDVAVNRIYIPVPMPIHVPTPLHMFTMSVPFLVPIPLPLPVPIFIPTGRKSVSGISKEIQKIKNRVPADPLEAELLMMAEMAAGDKKDESSSESDVDVSKEEPFAAETTEAEAAPGESFGEDVLTMALKMASNFDESGEATSTPAAPSDTDPTSRIESIMEAKRKNIRQAIKPKTRRSDPTPPVPQPQIPADAKNPDADLCLKYTFGVNAWKQWVMIKNAELQKTQKRPKLFKNELLQLTADDLNFSLCLFVQEVRKPNGAEYAPDTIYYLCLGIQQYLYENGRIDNIFCDSFYEKFTDTFNEVCQKFANLYNDSQYIVTRVEEEHLWESKQLGAHSPLVLLNTLMFFNTKHFSLTTVDEHLQLSFSHIMKHWKRNAAAPGSRSVLLRFYPPMSSEGRKKKVYEQQENDDNPLRCPVKLYEFYLSKCPESVKTRNDVFYLLPERSCVPDSPVWYSTMALDKEPLVKMLNRIKMVKEINVALLTT